MVVLAKYLLQQLSDYPSCGNSLVVKYFVGSYNKVSASTKVHILLEVGIRAW